MSKRPAEAYGYPVSDMSKQAQSARQRYWCPFINVKCPKQSRMIDYPMGVCTIKYNEETIAICPKRFLQNRKVFEDIADHYFGTRSDLIVFSEARLQSIGTFDYVMVKHRPMSSDIQDFVVIEIQAAQTTGTGKLIQGLKDFMNGKNIAYCTYAFGLNTYDVWKRSFTQILNKGLVLEAWQRKIYWVSQEQVFRYLENRYRLGDMKYQASHATIFSLYDFELKNGRFTLVHRGLKSSNIDDLFHAFSTNPDIPKREDFEATLYLKAKANLGFTLG